MKKRIFIIGLAILSLFLCSCEKDPEKTYTSISTSFTMEKTEFADRVIVSAHEKESGEKLKVTLTPGEKKVIEVEPGTYLISDVSSGDKRIDIEIKEQYFTVSKSHRYVTFSVKEESEKSIVEWFFYNNSLYLIGLVGCAVFLGISKYKEEKKMRERRSD